MSLSRESVEKIASLARVRLEDEERVLYQEQLGSILEYVEQLGAADTSGVSELARGTTRTNVMRADESIPCDPAVREAMIKAFPRRQGALLEVQAVFEGRTE
ncbi:MAG TPA: Asp-tRNA(Asn)/Glu-tRNA(Gln) amidotransferase subunit GatC [Patescibacteria group bacterium]|nr:Asp-tRNA(Asn)/Glu-tRNA(Gln) amidotransferase subunit GatC [Patescibacteria group bacterium]